MSNLNHIKAGDTVFVVYQQTRWQQKENNQRHTEYAKVLRKGRKYGYIEQHGNDAPFHLDAGHSHHRDSNARANGYGFDVYPSEAAWLAEVHYQEEHARLNERLNDRWGLRKDLCPSVITTIHQILDEAE